MTESAALRPTPAEMMGHESLGLGTCWRHRARARSSRECEVKFVATTRLQLQTGKDQARARARARGYLRKNNKLHVLHEVMMDNLQQQSCNSSLVRPKFYRTLATASRDDSSQVSLCSRMTGGLHAASNDSFRRRIRDSPVHATSYPPHCNGHRERHNPEQSP